MSFDLMRRAPSFTAMCDSSGSGCGRPIALLGPLRRERWFRPGHDLPQAGRDRADRHHRLRHDGEAALVVREPEEELSAVAILGCLVLPKLRLQLERVERAGLGLDLLPLEDRGLELVDLAAREHVDADVLTHGERLGSQEIEGRNDVLHALGQGGSVLPPAPDPARQVELLDLIGFIAPLARDFQPLRFEKHAREGRYESDELEEFDMTRRIGSWREDRTPLPERVQDIISSFYFLRTQPLAVGQDVHVDMFSRGKVYKLKAQVLGKERVETEAGVFDAFKLQPQRRENETDEDRNRGKLFLWFSDDERRLPVMARTVMPIGSVTALSLIHL